MNIAISGHTGFIGTKLKEFFTASGHKITGIGREDFAKGSSHLAGLIEGQDVLINLAGAPIVKRWTKSYSKTLWDSRIITTRLLTDAIAETRERPKAFFSSSAIGYYAHGETHTEEKHNVDEGFLGILCQRWEEEALRARIHCNTYIIRTGVVLGKEGGALPRMALPFRLFAGGKIGSGNQVLSWIHMEDFANALQMLMEKMPEVNIFNFTAPNPESNKEFSKQIAQVLSKPNFFTVPPFMLRMIFGEGATTLIHGQTVLPKNLQDLGYKFQFPQLKSALEDLLK